MSNIKVKQKSIKINAVLNVVKQCSSVFFPLITYPYISRVLGANNFGRINFASSIIEYGLVFAMFGIPTYVVREGSRIRENKQKIKELVTEVFSISLITMIISLCAISILSLLAPRLNAVKMIIFILSFNIIFSVLGRDWINTIYEDYLYVTVRYIVFKVVALVLIFLWVTKPEHFLRYAIIMVVSESGGYIANIFYTGKYVPFSITFNSKLLTHIKPLLFLFCSTLAINIYIQSDITILGFLRTDSEIGVYSLASKIYSVVKSILNAVILVAIPRLSFFIGNDRIDEYNNLLGKLKGALVTLLFPFIVGGFALARNIMQIMGGKEYTWGYKSFEVLCLALLFAVLGCYYAQGIMIPNKKEKEFFYCTTISAVTNILLNLFFVRRYGIEGAAFTTLIAEMLILFNCMYFSKGLHSEKMKDSFISVVIGCIAVFVICTGIRILQLNVIFETVVAIITSVICYLLVLIAFRHSLLMDVWRSVLNKFFM